MGNINVIMREIQHEIELLREELRLMQFKMSSFQERQAGLEKDVSNLSVILKRVDQKSGDNSNSLLNLSLLEEGRSIYRRPKRHTGSSYN